MEAFFAYALALCAVLLFSSLSGLVSERAGVVNVAIEGMMSIGALFTAILGTVFNKNGNNNSQIYAVIIAALIAGVFALLHAFPSITLKANQIVSGTALNILALGTSMFLATSGYFGADKTDINSGYQPITLGGQTFPVWLLIAIIVAVLIGVFFKFTKFGMRYTMTGENPNAVDAAGISVNKYRYIAVFVSGILAGFAGGAMVTTVIGAGLFMGTTYGFGFLALAIMIFGQWRIHYLALGVVLFAFLFAVGNRLGVLIDPNSAMVNWARIFQVLPFVMTIGIMIFFAKRSKAPAADGEPFDKARR